MGENVGRPQAQNLLELNDGFLVPALGQQGATQVEPARGPLRALPQGLGQASGSLGATPRFIQQHPEPVEGFGMLRPAGKHAAVKRLGLG
ncbi:MAG: hypothetical protein KatS3mg131_1304 [Candidatus Tectimicrobiota bacterium]|nr:MAG: hypothetical protein KatS3mg131_1304 [Candidatus Tectomicrobia bacterium]